MKNLLKGVYLVLFGFITLSLHAQEPMVLSLDSAINYALRNNKTLINSKYVIDKSMQKKKEAIAGGLPQINASIDYTNYLGAEIELKLSDQAPAVSIPFNPTSNIKLTATQLVFSGSYYIGLQLSTLAYNVTVLDYQKNEIEVKEEVAKAYYLVLVAERELNIISSNNENTSHIYEKTKNLAKAGIIEQTEADKLFIMLTSVENTKKATERQIEMAYNLLRLNLGVNADKTIKLSTTLDELVNNKNNVFAEQEAFNIEKNYDYKLISAQEGILKKQITLAQTNYLPDIAGFYSYTEKILTTAFDMTPKNVIGLSANIPIFSSGMRKAKVSQAKIDLAIIKNSKDLATQQINIQEKQLRYNLKNILEQFENQKNNVEIAKEVYNKMSLKYQQGIVSSLELTSADSNYLNAEAAYTNLIFQLLDAEISLRKINGKL